jgi:hypothetical protein
MRRGAAMMRLPDPYLTPAQVGLMIVAVLLLGAMVVQVITVSEHREVRTQTTPETVGRVTPDISAAGLRGSLP